MTSFETWNPWHGCRKYSEGCENCYMYFLDRKRGRNGGDIFRSLTNFDLPLKKNRAGEYKVKSGTMLHVCMTSDFFLEDADEWRNEAWSIIRSRPDVDFWLQTKRASRVAEHLPYDWGDGWDNVTICFTTENQKRADERLPILIGLPAKHKAFMCAPILSGIDISEYLNRAKFDLVLADGENYEGLRPCRYEWIVALHDSCAAAKVPFRFAGTGGTFVKDGKEYHICKAYQSVEARRAGLNYPPEPCDLPVQRRCADCKRREECNGCNFCGKCGSY